VKNGPTFAEWLKGLNDSGFFKGISSNIGIKGISFAL
jgi:hypothetical protein